MSLPVSVNPTVGAMDKASRGFKERFGHGPAGIARAPGRVNLLGEHVDYNDGFVLPAAIDRATFVAYAPSDENRSTLWALDFHSGTSFLSRDLERRSDVDGTALEPWAKYPAGVAWSLQKQGLKIVGLEAAYASDVPRGAGLSSSASVELAFAMAWQDAGEWSALPMDLAKLCQRAENQYVGVKCGIMDQAASACGEEGRVLLLDCRTLEIRAVPLPPGLAIVVAYSGVRHSLAGSAYNRRRAACEEAVRLLGQSLPGIKALRDVPEEEFDRLAPMLPREVEMRARHVVEEIDRTRQAVPLLEAGDAAAFGRLMNECHASLRDLYEVSCPELDALARIAQPLDGCHGARLTGAGFGGCTVNLVAADKADGFGAELAARYEEEVERHAVIYVCKPSAGAAVVQRGT